MIDNKLHTPEGVKDYLPEEYMYKSEVESRIETVFKRYAYNPVKSPAFEYAEVFEGKGSIDTTRMHKFLDRDGSILALRSDMTAAIARIAATAYNTEALPLRFYYIEDSFRYNKHYQGKLREFTQAGIELIGINSIAADAEVLAAAINSLLSAGLTDFVINIGNAAFLAGLLAASGLDEQTCKAVKELITAKDYAGVQRILKNNTPDEKIAKLLERLPFLIGTTELIEDVHSIVNNEKSAEAVAHLKAIYDIMTDYGLEKYIRFDLSLLGDLDYYTGLIFRGYTTGTGFSVIDGGRYDSLSKKYGASYPSVGFAIKINDLISALKSQGINFEHEYADTLLAYSPSGRKNALAAADELRRNGLNIENSLLGDDLKRNMQYAHSKNMGGILFFGENDIVRAINLNDNTEKEINISDLFGED